MTEEIIIDGVNVAECEFYFEDNGVIAPDGTPERANLCTSPEKSCENSDSCYCNKDCYYKQLKRLKKENKSFEILAKTLYERIKVLEKENEALAFRERLYKADYEASEQENKRLKEEKEKYKPFYELGAKCIQLNEVADSLNNLNSKYKSALEEIKKMVDCTNCEYESNDNCNPQQCSKIENKINEVLK